MESWDSVITFGILAAAAFYVVRKFAKARKGGGGCGCSSESGCCGSGEGHSTGGCNERHH